MTGAHNIDFVAMLAGAYYACAIIFIGGAIGFAIATRDRLYVYFALHALAMGGLSLTFPPIGPAFDAVETTHITARIVADSAVLATVGLLVSRIALAKAPRWLYWPIRGLFPFGVISGCCAWYLANNVHLLPAYGAALLAALLTLAVALIVCSWRGSRGAKVLGVALTPLIIVGTTAAALEAMPYGSLTFYAEGMLFGFTFELIFVSAIVALRHRDAMRDRDRALAEAIAARKDSETDPLTGLLNRRGLDLAIADGTRQNFTALALMDCDRFKIINDRFGHAVGDQVLQIIGRHLLIHDALAARIGGEEFILLMTGHDWHERLERLRRDIEQRVADRLPNLRLPVTVSVGVVMLDRDSDIAGAMSVADKALYAAKANGRDRLEIAPSTSPDLRAAA